MEQPTNSTVKKEQHVSVPVELMSLAEAEDKELDDLEEQQRLANVVCDSVDLIVKSRAAAITAIRDSHTACISAKLQLMMSQFPAHIRKMPMKKFLKRHCPNIFGDGRSDGTLSSEVAQDPMVKLRTPGELLPFSSSTLAFDSELRTRQVMQRRSEASTVEISSGT